MSRFRRTARRGRSGAEILRDTLGREVPTVEPEQVAEQTDASRWSLLRDGRPAGPRPRARGRRAAGNGFTALSAPLVTYRASTAEACGLYQWIAAASTPPVGAWLGPDYLSGGGFFVHPGEWVRRGRVTNPNMIIFGEPGRGKSTYIKVMCWRLSAFGVRTLIVGDTKNEYSDLVRGMGQEPLALGSGYGVRINPLDAGTVDGLSGEALREQLTEIRARRLVLLRALLAAGRYEMNTSDEATLAAVLAELTGESTGNSTLRTPTIPDVHRALAFPSKELARERRCESPADLAERSRGMTDALGAMVDGALAGLFDEQTNVSIDFAAPIQSLNLRGLSARGEQAVAVALLCMGSWAQAAQNARQPGDLSLVVRDEMWRVMRLGKEFVAAIDAQLRLSRTAGEFHVLAAHKPSDMLTVGDAGSKEVHIARDLLSLCDTRVLLGQSAGVTADLAEEIGLTDREQGELMGWANGQRGRAIWKVGQYTHKVRCWLTPEEETMFNTDGALFRPTVAA